LLQEEVYKLCKTIYYHNIRVHFSTSSSEPVGGEEQNFPLMRLTLILKAVLSIF